MEQEIIQHEEKFLQALRSLNLEVLDELIHDKVIYNTFTGEVIDKEADFAPFKSGNSIVKSVDCIERKIQLFEDAAVVSTVVHLKATIMEHEVDAKTRFLRTWKKFEKGWKIIGVAAINL